jgi:hypothetical protein
VHAFVALARDLLAHGAPDELVQGALAAAQDEVGHASMMYALAVKHGVTPQAPEVAVLPVRPLEALALENAIEGCVRETWGAMLALHQARAAADAEVRAAFEQIAADELGHASLAWAIDRWVQPRLGETARARVHTARLSLAAELASERGEGDAVLGLPGAVESRRMLDEAYAQIWS